MCIRDSVSADVEREASERGRRAAGGLELGQHLGAVRPHAAPELEGFGGLLDQHAETVTALCTLLPHPIQKTLAGGPVHEIDHQRVGCEDLGRDRGGLAGQAAGAGVDHELERAGNVVQAIGAQRDAAMARHGGVTLGAYGLDDIPGPFEFVVNASASSLAGEAAPVSAEVLTPDTLVVDLMYGPASQGFLDWVRQQGAEGRDGLGMLVEQAAEAFQLWRGVRPDSAQVLAELEAARRAPATL